jgi:acetolactate synthase I/II/III large subunit
MTPLAGNSIADAMAGFLRDRGVQHVFGIPGGEIVPLVEALRKSGVHFVLMHHEVSAGFAADVTGQISGIPGVCLSTVGPGAMNLLAGAASATLERSPVLAISAEVDREFTDRILHMNVNLRAAFGSAVKGSFSLTPQNVLQSLETAWALALMPPKGAVHLAVSNETSMLPLDDAAREVVDIPQTPEFSSLDGALIDLLSQAKAPILLAGSGVGTNRAESNLLSLAKSWGIPVAVTPKAKGYFPENHPLFCGCFSAYGDAPLRKCLSDADLILGVGLDGADIVTSTWDISTPVVSLNGSMAGDPVFRPIFEAGGDLPELLASLRHIRTVDQQGEGRASLVRSSIEKALQTGFRPSSGIIPINDLILAARRALPASGRITIDVGAFKLVLLQTWKTDIPNSLFVANGMSAMGYAVPGAIALKLARPEIPVMAIVGDGALLMYAGELATVARLALPLVILVIVDRSLALIRLKQLRQRVPATGTEFNAVDFQHLAAAFSLGYGLIDRREDAETKIREAIDLERPVLLEARIDVAEYDHFL